jgi:hypothetical protein
MGAASMSRFPNSMERKFHEDMAAQRKEQAWIAECFREWKEQMGDDLGVEMAFRSGYAQGKYDALHPGWHEASNASPVRVLPEPEQSPTGNTQVTPGAVQGGPLDLDSIKKRMARFPVTPKACEEWMEHARLEADLMMAEIARLAALRSQGESPQAPDALWGTK